LVLLLSHAKNKKKILCCEKKSSFRDLGKKTAKRSKVARLTHRAQRARFKQQQQQQRARAFGDDHDDEWQTRHADDDVGNHATAVAKNPVVIFNEHF
jgi:hypothetical protein